MNCGTPKSPRGEARTRWMCIRYLDTGAPKSDDAPVPRYTLLSFISDTMPRYYHTYQPSYPQVRYNGLLVKGGLDFQQFAR